MLFPKRLVAMVLPLIFVTPSGVFTMNFIRVSHLILLGTVASEKSQEKYLRNADVGMYSAESDIISGRNDNDISVKKKGSSSRLLLSREDRKNPNKIDRLSAKVSGLNKISNNLQHQDAGLILSEVKDTLQEYMFSAQLILDKISDGDYKGSVNTMKETFGGIIATSNGSNTGGDHIDLNSALDADLTLGNMNSSDIVQFMQHDTFQHSLVNGQSLVEELEHFKQFDFAKTNEGRFSDFTDFNFNLNGDFSFNGLNDLSDHDKLFDHPHWENIFDDELLVTRHASRVKSLGDRCESKCKKNDVMCNCGKLHTCAKKMNLYDYLLLSLKGYVNTNPDGEDYGKLNIHHKDLNLFSIESGITAKYNQLKDMVNNKSNDETYCSNLLREFQSPCDPVKKSCSKANKEMFQLSVDQVCSSVGASTKVLLETIAYEFDDFNTTQMLENQPLSFKMCTDFAIQFDELYKARDKVKYTHSNPMRKISTQDLTGENALTHVHFPVEYAFIYDNKGIVDRSHIVPTSKIFLDWISGNFEDHGDNGMRIIPKYFDWLQSKQSFKPPFEINFIGDGGDQLRTYLWLRFFSKSNEQGKNPASVVEDGVVDIYVSAFMVNKKKDVYATIEPYYYSKGRRIKIPRKLGYLNHWGKPEFSVQVSRTGLIDIKVGFIKQQKIHRIKWQCPEWDTLPRYKESWPFTMITHAGYSTNLYQRPSISRGNYVVKHFPKSVDAKYSPYYKMNKKTALEAMISCDQSMKLLLGKKTSIGSLTSIVDLVKEKGPSKMPGVCCLDNASNSDMLGYNYNPKRNMNCLNHGPWHLGLTNDACKNAGGNWFRSPCVTLKTCIDSRPGVKDEGFSESFEKFVKPFVINDPQNENECRNARVELGFEEDHPFDTEVCKRFNNYMCRDYFTGIDMFTEDLKKKPKPKITSFKKAEYPANKPLKFKPLSDDLTVFKTPFEIGQTSEKLNKVQDTVQVLEHILDKTNSVLEFAKQAAKVCDALPIVVPAGPIGNLPNPVYIGCKVATTVAIKLATIVKTAAQIAQRVCSFFYQKATLDDGELYDTYYYSMGTFENFKEFAMWNKESLDIINLNMLNQHTDMRDQLQKRHEEMQNCIVCKTAYRACELLHHIKGGAKCRDNCKCGASTAEELNLNAQLPEDHKNIWETLQHIEMKGEMIEETVKAIQEIVVVGNNEGGSINLSMLGSQNKMSTVGKDKDVLNKFTNEAIIEAVNTTSNKVDAISTKVDTNEIKLDSMRTKVDTIEVNMDTMRTKVDNIDVNMDTMRTKADTNEIKLDAMRTKVDNIEEKMDSIEVKMDKLIGIMG